MSALEELHVRHDASTRQRDTLTLLLEREETTLAAMERRAAVVVDDWAVLDAARTVLDAAVDTGATNEDRREVADAVCQFEQTSDDAAAMPYATLLCALPKAVVALPVAEDASAMEASRNRPPPLDADTKWVQLCAFNEQLRASQEQISVLSQLHEHESQAIATLERIIADADPSSPPPPRRRAAPAPGKAPAPASPVPASRNVSTASIARMHSAEGDAVLPLQPMRAARAATFLAVGAARSPWNDALRLAEKLRTQCAARATSATHEELKASEASELPTVEKLVDLTDELAFEIRKAGGIRAPQRSRSESMTRGRLSHGRLPPASASASSSHAPVGAAAGSTEAAASDQPPPQSAQEQADQLQDEVDMLNARVTELQESLTQRDGTIEKLTDDVKKEKTEHDVTRAQRDEARSRATELQQAVDALTAERDQLQKRADETEAFLAEARATLEEVRVEREQMVKEHAETLAERDARIAALQKENEAQHDKIVTLRNVEESALKWKGREAELAAAAEASHTGFLEQQKRADDAELALSKIQVRAAHDQLVARETRLKNEELVKAMDKQKKAHDEAVAALRDELEASQQALAYERSQHDRTKEEHRATAAELAHERECLAMVEEDLATSRRLLDEATSPRRRRRATSAQPTSPGASMNRAASFTAVSPRLASPQQGSKSATFDYYRRDSSQPSTPRALRATAAPLSPGTPRSARGDDPAPLTAVSSSRAAHEADPPTEVSRSHYSPSPRPTRYDALDATPQPERSAPVPTLGPQQTRTLLRSWDQTSASRY